MNVCECSQDTTFTHLAKTLYAKLTQFLGGCAVGAIIANGVQKNITLLQPLCLRCGHCSHYRGAPSLSKMPFNEIETNESQKSLMSSPQRGQFFMRNVSWLSDLSHSIEDAIIIL